MHLQVSEVPTEQFARLVVQVFEDLGIQPYHEAPQPPIQLLGFGQRGLKRCFAWSGQLCAAAVLSRDVGFSDAVRLDFLLVFGCPER